MQNAQSGNLLISLIPMIILFVFFYFMIIRPQKKKEKEIKDMRDSIKIGDDIITIGGIIAKVVAVKEDKIVIETSANKTRLDITKWGVSSVLTERTEESNDK